eukprot:m.247846 g.247846  ORF g.247846 m.247846 type:complete len:485 (+) comp17494_c0_seq2:77-1531(+)
MAEPKKISFGLGKSKQAVLREALQSKTPTIDQDAGEAIKGFASGLADPEKPKEEAKELVIPMVKVNKWAQPAANEAAETPTKQGDGQSADADVELTEDQKAVQAILEKAERHEQGERDEVDNVQEIPLLMQNRAPGTEGIDDDELKFKTDVALRPEVCTAEDYENTPIEQFGAAMLRGMGWKEGEAIGGINKGLAEPIEFVPRPHGLGLGATRNLQLKPDKRRRPRQYIKPGETREEVTTVSSKRGADGKVRHIKGVSETLVEAEDLRLTRGAYVLIQSGAHEHQVGAVTRLHNMMLDIKLSLSGVNVTIDEARCKVIGRHKHKDQLRMLKEGKGGRSQSGKRSASSASSDSKSSRSSKQAKRPWVRPEIRVRIVSQRYQKGKHYNKKVSVVDVISLDNITVTDDSGRMLEDLREKDLETIIPKKENAAVMVVRGQHAGSRGRMIEKRKSKEQVVVQLNGEPSVTVLSFDDVSEFVGQSRSEDW